MEPNTYRRQGAVIQTWGPFRIRAPTTLVTEGRPDRVMSWHMVSIMLDFVGERGEQREQALGPLDNADITPSGLVKMLRASLHSLEYAIDVLDRHLREMKDPERMTALQAALDEEIRTRESGAEVRGKTTETDKWEWTTAAEDVLANQREERVRLQTLYDAVQAGMRNLEEEFPELRADSS